MSRSARPVGDVTSFKDSAAMIGHIRGVIDGVVLSSNALPQLVMADLFDGSKAGFTMAMRCASATEARLDPLHIPGQFGVAQEPS
jgi:hypothetical protein